jgi:hypothetical protein
VSNAVIAERQARAQNPGRLRELQEIMDAARRNVVDVSDMEEG